MFETILLASLTIQPASPRYELRFYQGTAVPVLTAAVTPACGVPMPAPTPAVNPTRHVFTIGYQACVVESASILAQLPRGPLGEIYQGTVARCDAAGCQESARAEFCVGIPEPFARDAPDCLAVKRRMEAWFLLCVVFRICEP